MSERYPDDPKPWTVLSSSYLARKDWFTVRQDHVRLPTGGEIEEYWVSEFRPWVNVVAVTGSDDLVLLRQYRHGLGQVHFELPAGTTEEGESDLMAAAQRELLEETGYGGGAWRELVVTSANPALTNNLTHSFLAEGVTRLQEPRPEKTEDLRLHLVPVRDAAALMVAGEMIQALHIAPLACYLLQRR